MGIDKKNKKKNICFMAPLPPPYGGIANWTATICEWLDNYKEDDIAYTVINTAPKSRVTDGRTIIDRVLGGITSMLVSGVKLKRLIRVDIPSCVHITTSGSLGVYRDLLIAQICTRNNIPFVYHIHFGRIPQLVESLTREWKNLKRVMDKASSVIAIDVKTYHAIDKVYQNEFPQKVSYIPNPIDTAKLPAPAAESNNKVMYLGWVIKEKGIEELLEAWEQIYSEKQAWTLDIVGPIKEEYKDFLIQKFSLRGVNLLGEKSHDEAMGLMNESDIFVLPSYSEGCPYVILEAMALGKRIVASDVGNIRFMMGEVSGTLVEPCNVAMLRKALKKEISSSDDLRRNKDNIMNRCRELYSMEIIVKQYFEKW